MKHLARIVKALVSLAFFAVLFSFVRKSDLAALCRSVDPLYLALSLLIIPAQLGVSCLKWKLLIDQPGRKIPFWFLMRMYLIGYYFSNLLPSNVGGDVARSYYAGRRVGSQGHAAISVFIERFTGSVCMLLLVLVCPLLLPGAYRHPAFSAPAAVALALLAAAAWVARLKRPLPALLGGLRRLLGLAGETGAGSPPAGLRARADRALQRAATKAERIHARLVVAVASLRTDRRKLAAVIALTVLFYALTWLNVYWSFRTFGVVVRFRDVVCVLPTAMLVGMLPVTLGSLGIAEGSYVCYFGLVGVAPAATFAMGLFLRLKLLAVGAAGLASYLAHAAPTPSLPPEPPPD